MSEACKKVLQLSACTFVQTVILKVAGLMNEL